jgi:hypothetical protein
LEKAVTGNRSWQRKKMRDGDEVAVLTLVRYGNLAADAADKLALEGYPDWSL